jgi:hypothetical protein
MMTIGGAAGAGIYLGLKKTALIFAPGSDGIITIPGINAQFTIQSLADVAQFFRYGHDPIYCPRSLIY